MRNAAERDPRKEAKRGDNHESDQGTGKTSHGFHDTRNRRFVQRSPGGHVCSAGVLACILPGMGRLVRVAGKGACATW
ncbi:MAG: hypothetical protein AMXMBFR82_08840 [Candidatus Hydrogenedentota bacterium]